MSFSNTTVKISVTDEMIGQRLDKALSLIPEIGTRSRAETLLEKGLVLVKGKPAKSSHKVSAKDEITVSFPPAQSTELTKLDLPLDILFEDDDLLVVNKPAGLVVHPAAGHAEDTLVNALLHHTKNLSMKFGEERPGIVHRLDRDTSGLLVVAKNDFAHEHLAAQFKAKTTHRIYYAVVFGKPAHGHGKIQSYLDRHPTDRKKYASCRDNEKSVIRTPVFMGEAPGKWAVTHYRLLKSAPTGLSLVELKLETGRTHQIRVHMSELGNALVADPIYGSAGRINNLNGQTTRAWAKNFPRLALHAAELGFVHPLTEKNMMFKVDWPEPELSLIHEMFGKDTDET